MKWEIAKIGEISDIIDGDRGKNYPKQNEFHDKGYCLFLNTGNVTRQGFDFNNNMFITKEKDNVMRKGKLKRGDIVFTSRGTIGNTAYYNDTIPFDNVRINSGMVILRTKQEKVEQRYLYQLLKSNYQRERMQSYITGSAQPQLPIKNFSQIELPLPPLQIQCRIADILSAYDDLIENNQKQIKLLEEAAMRLYKEWFVHLRFPGHETTKIVDGVPEGWHLGILEELIEVKYGKDHKNVANGDIPVYGSGGLMRKCNRFLHDGESVLIPRKGSLNHIMYVNEKFWTVDTMFFTQMKCNNIALYIYFFMCSFDMYSMNIGAAVPSMTTNTLNGLDVLIPEETLLGLFNNSAQIYFQRIAVLKNQNHKAEQARDKLLPKLMSGEIEI